MPDVEAKIIERELASKLMRRVMPFLVVTPPGYAASNLRYPVLYLLHGLFGAFNNWVTLTGLTRHAAQHELIIVTPEGGDGWYTDSATVTDEKFESYLIEELFPEVEKDFRTIAERSGRAIAGLSMGGYGALKFALKNPAFFAMAASISGAFDCSERSNEDPGFDWENLRPSVMRAFGELGSAAREENDLYKLAASVDTENLLRIYFDCGTGDGFIPANRRLSQMFSESQIAHTYAEFPGEHDWEYWDRRVQHILDLASETLERPRP